MKHMETRCLWTQERLALGRIKLDTVASKDNCSDSLTAYLGDDKRVIKWKKEGEKKRQEREDEPNNGSD